MHVECRGKQSGDILDGNLSGDVQATECAALDDVTRVVGFAR